MPDVANDDPAYPGQVFREWRRLGRPVHEQVFHLATQGRPYPDDVVAAKAARWAECVLSGDRPWWDYVWGVPYMLVGFVAAGSSYGGDIPDPVGTRRERLARAVKRANGRRE